MAMHEAAVCRNENKTLAVFRLVTRAAEDLSKRHHCQAVHALTVLTGLQPLSENVTVCNGVAVALFVTKSEALGSKVMVVRFVER
jgi:hypothetical protein